MLAAKSVFSINEIHKMQNRGGHQILGFLPALLQSVRNPFFWKNVVRYVAWTKLVLSSIYVTQQRSFDWALTFPRLIITAWCCSRRVNTAFAVYRSSRRKSNPFDHPRFFNPCRSRGTRILVNTLKLKCSPHFWISSTRTILRMIQTFKRKHKIVDDHS